LQSEAQHNGVVAGTGVPSWMSWRSEWAALSERIGGVVDACRFMTTSLTAQNSDQFGVTRKILMPEVADVVSRLRSFATLYAGSLPPQTASALTDLLDRIPPATGGSGHSAPLLDLQIAAALGVVRSRVDYLLKEPQARLRVLMERALEHLQRTIVVDPAARERWRAAFATGETRCEALGATHLLAHGIWAFKVHGSGDASGSGEATDLVYQEPLADRQTAEGVADGLVLTEWKLVRSATEVDGQQATAIKQAELYRSGVLGGLELVGTRYVVLVSEDIARPSSETLVGNCVYRTVMVRVSPSSPSVSARRP
jgi:hypothetical protein